MDCIDACPGGDSACITECYDNAEEQAQTDYTDFWTCNSDNSCSGNPGCLYEHCKDLGIECGELKEVDSSYSAPYGTASLSAIFEYIVSDADGSSLSSEKLIETYFISGTIGSGTFNNPTQQGIFSYADYIIDAVDGDVIQMVQQPYANNGSTNLNPVVFMIIPVGTTTGTVTAGLTNSDKVSLYVADTANGKVSCIHAFGVGDVSLTDFNTALGAAGRIAFTASNIQMYNPKNAPVYGGDISDTDFVACAPR